MAKKRRIFKIGSRAWKRFRHHHHDIEVAIVRAKLGNPSRIDPNHPLAPKSHPLPKSHKHVKPKLAGPLAAHIVYWCHIALKYAGKMTYSENYTLRQELFHRAIGKFLSSVADCSQFVASILHWLGVKVVTATDYTGTLLQKGKLLAGPQPGCVAIWGPHTGAHAAFITEKTADGKDWYCVGFGHQGAPDRNTLSGMNAYFAGIGEPGVRFLEFSR
jgi:hypothetical protein